VSGPAEAPPECYDIDVDVPRQPRDDRIGGLLDGVGRDRNFHAVAPPAPSTIFMPRPEANLMLGQLFVMPGPHACAHGRHNAH
jgi:hypothetical protein